MSVPEVSVVMAVRDGGPGLAGTVASVLSQQGVDLELVVVDDGSADETPRALAQIAAGDRRVRVLTQANAGLTRALIRGCAAARAPLIARQDAGDLSLPGRLRAERDLLGADPGLAFVACGWELVGPGGELLQTQRGEARAAATARLRQPDEATLGNPPHPTVMFRRGAYDAAGGYRDAFAIGQDVDLWVRMARQGDLAYVPEVLYRVVYSLEGISARRAGVQRQVRRLIVESARAAGRGESDAGILQRAQALSASGGPEGEAGRARARARAAYFVGACLRRRGDRRAARYFREALRANPLHAKALAALVLSGMGGGRGARR